MPIIREDIRGFTPPGVVSRGCHRRSAIAVQLLTSFALLAAIVVTAFAVTTEFAAAGALQTVHGWSNGVASTVFLLLLLGTGALTAFATLAPLACCKPLRAGR